MAILCDKDLVDSFLIPMTRRMLTGLPAALMGHVDWRPYHTETLASLAFISELPVSNEAYRDMFVAYNRSLMDELRIQMEASPGWEENLARVKERTIALRQSLTLMR